LQCNPDGESRGGIMTLMEACNQIGIEYREVPADDKRYSTPVISKGGKNTAGRIKLFSDGKGGIVSNWTKAENLTFWYDDIPAKLTTEQKQERAARIEAAKRQEEADKAECRQRSAELWKLSREEMPADHPYLIKKRVKPYGIRWQQSGNLLVIPVQDMAGTLHGLQFIDPEGSKRFKSDTDKLGHFHRIPGKGKIVICEGYATGASIHEATGFCVLVAFDAGNLLPVSTAAREKWQDRQIIIAADDDYATAGNPGLTKATAAARAITGLLAIPSFPDNRGVKDTDFNDMARLTTPEAVRACIDGTAIVTPAPAEENPAEAATESNLDPLTVAVNRLAKLSPLEYDRVRKGEAKALGVRPGTLDAAIKGARKEESTESGFEEVELWPDPVDGAALLTAITATIKRFIICEPHTAQAVALWVAMTWFIDVVQVAPLAVITAPEKRCGKSMLLFLIGRLVPRPLMSSSISPSALFRSIDAWQPTLLIDEVDACLKDNEELRGLINCGHTRDSAFTIRCVGDDHTPKRFNVWGAKALSGIGHVADTLMDRSIILELRRKLSHESVERIRHAEAGLFSELCSKLARFAEDNSEQVRLARPSLPPSLNDRAQDNWEPLLAIATVAGGEWFKIGTAAALKISGGESLALSIGTELLSDIQEIFEHKQVDRISTAELIKELIVDDEKPWATFNKGLPIKPRQIAHKLKGYGIQSKTIRIGIATAKGFEKEQFAEAFSRYIPIPLLPNVTTSQTAPQATLPVTDNPSRYLSVTDETTRKPVTCADVSLLRIETPFQADIILTESDFEGVTL